MWKQAGIMLNHLIKLLLLPTMFFFAIPLYSQEPEIAWMAQYGSSWNDYGHAVVECYSGGYAVLGATNSSIAQGFDIYLIRTDAYGGTLWSRTYGGWGLDYGFSIDETPDHGFIITGATSSFPNCDNCVYLLKTDSLGNVIWDKCLDMGYIDWGYQVISTSDNGYVLAGYTVLDENEYNKQVLLMKTDSLGNLEWAKDYGGPRNDEAFSICEIYSDKYALVGYTEVDSTRPADVWLLVVDGEGDTLFTRTYGGYISDIGYWVDNTSQGGLIIAGESESFGDNWYDVYLCAVDSLGNIMWETTYGGDDIESGRFVQQLPDGNYYIAGYTHSFGLGHADLYLLKVDSTGSLIWDQTVGGTTTDIGWSGLVNSHGEYIAVGYTASFGNGLFDAFLVQLESDRVNVSEDQIIPGSLSLNNHPNPFNASTTIRYYIPNKSEISLSIYNLLGQRVETLVEGAQNPGEHTLTWDASHLPSGVYFARLEAGGRTENIKMVLLK